MGCFGEGTTVSMIALDIGSLEDCLSDTSSSGANGKIETR
jgi:hypothetical protein